MAARIPMTPGQFYAKSSAIHQGTWNAKNENEKTQAEKSATA
jgi:hypothetical protein